MTLRTSLFVVAALCAFGPAHAAPDALRGEQVYVRCLACHSLQTDRVGPRHCGLFGRLAGTVPGFDYSEAMKRSNIRWDEKSLDRFLAKPLDIVPGSSMTYDGISDPRDRSDLIAYLKQANDSPACAQRTPRVRR